MSGDSCKVKTVVVDVQENGIIRILGRYAARLDRDIAFDAIAESPELLELAALREQVKVLREALVKISKATGDEHEDGLWWFYEVAEKALAQTKPKEGE